MDENIVAELKQRLNTNSSDIEAAITLGNIYYDVGDPAQAILYYRQALDINPDVPGVLTDMGTMYWRNNDINLAEQAFREAIAKDGSFGNAYVNLGQLLYRAKNDVVEARVVWQQLLTVNLGHAAVAKARELLWETATPVNG